MIGLLPLVALASSADIAREVEAMGGEAVRDAKGAIVEISLARTWANDNILDRVAEAKDLQRLDLSFTYVTDRGIEKLQKLPKLEELNLHTAEFITDAAMSYLRANKSLRKLVLRGTDVTDVSMPYIAELTNLRALDLSQTMLGDGGLESLPALAQLEELDLGGSRLSGINLNFLKLLPKLRKLGLQGIQRRNGGACWTATITDLDLATIALLSNLEELDIGAGIGLGRTGKPGGGERNCRPTGGVQITDLGIVKLAKLKKLRRLDLSGAKLTSKGLDGLRAFPLLERLSLWNCGGLDDASADTLASLPNLATLDLSDTPLSDAALAKLKVLPRLKQLYLTNTKVTAEAAEAFKKEKPGCFVSWAKL
jgi:Leucine-rich repeat (LRR) protein